MVETIKTSELYDEFRIESGLIVKVSKYKVNRDKEYSSDKLGSRKYKKKVKGLYHIYELKEDLEFDCGTVFPKGTYLEYSWSNRYKVVNLVTNPNLFFIEVTCAGGSISGAGNTCVKKLDKISNFLKERYGL